jgi:predicted glutamine amidotransferase
LNPRCFLAHVRAAIGSPVQQTNCHPFGRGRWLFVHNGFLADFHELRRELMLAIDPALFGDLQGSTDTEVVFHVALTFGLEEDPVGALEQAVGLIEQAARRQGIAGAVQASFGVSDGTSLWAMRYATTGPRAPCSRRPTSTRCGACIPTTRAFNGSARTTA